MYIRNFKMKMIVGMGLLAMLVALPGAAKPEAPGAAPAHKAQSAFGLFLDPHVEPELHFELPKSFRF